MKVIIIDDEASSIEALQQKLATYDDVEVVGTASNGLKGLNLLRTTPADLLFLDVELPDMSGLEFLEQQENITLGHCRIVMYTAHSHYMLPSFRNKAFDFLLKPIDEQELQKVLKRYYIEEGKATRQSAGPRKNSEKVVLYTNMTDFRVVDMRGVGLFQYNHEQRVWEVVMAGQQEPLHLKRAQNNETLVGLDPRFVQVNQKYIININYLMEVRDNICRFYPPFDHLDYVNVGRQYRKKFIERFSMF